MCLRDRSFCALVERTWSLGHGLERYILSLTPSCLLCLLSATMWEAFRCQSLSPGCFGRCPPWTETLSQNKPILYVLGIRYQVLEHRKVAKRMLRLCYLKTGLFLNWRISYNTENLRSLLDSCIENVFSHIVLFSILLILYFDKQKFLY